MKKLILGHLRTAPAPEPPPQEHPAVALLEYDAPNDEWGPLPLSTWIIGKTFRRAVNAWVQAHPGLPLRRATCASEFHEPTARLRRKTADDHGGNRIRLPYSGNSHYP